MIKLLRDSHGMTLVEGMVAAGIVGFIVVATMKGTDYLNKTTKKMSQKTSTTRIVLSLANTIRSNVSLYQIDQNPNHEDGMLNITNKEELFKALPLAWNEKIITDVRKCPQCDGRVGFVITPLSSVQLGGYRGMYRLTIRMVHRTLIDNFKDFEFLISGK